MSAGGGGGSPAGKCPAGKSPRTITDTSTAPGRPMQRTRWVPSSLSVHPVSEFRKGMARFPCIRSEIVYEAKEAGGRVTITYLRVTITYIRVTITYMRVTITG